MIIMIMNGNYYKYLINNYPFILLDLKALNFIFNDVLISNKYFFLT